MKSNTTKFILLYLGIIAIAVAASVFFSSCSSVKKNISSLKTTSDSTRTEQSSSSQAATKDSTGQTKEKGDYTRETVIEEFMGGDQADEILADSSVMEDRPLVFSTGGSVLQTTPSGKLFRRTTIKETGNFEKEQTAQVKQHDTATQQQSSAADVKKTSDAKSKVVDKKSFPWGTIIFWGIVAALLVGAYLYLRHLKIL